MNRTLTWLHLSDLHARARTDWDSRKIIDTLVRDLKIMQNEHGLRPDFIFFTGDIVFGAANGENMADQYELARLFFDAVRFAFVPEIPVRDLYLVPGNHDIERAEVTPDQTEWLRHPDRQLSEIVSSMQDSKKQWRTWMDRLVNYRIFLTSYGLFHLSPDDPHLIWADAREIHGIRVGIAGLNSAWSCADNDDKAKLWFGGDWQVSQVKHRMGPVAFEIALFHHPGNWFTEKEDPSVMRHIRQDFAVVLHGHEHQDWVEIDSEGHITLSASACYESSWMANGYSMGQINLQQNSGEIRLRQWDTTGRGWVERNIAGKTQHGCWPLPSLPWIKSPTQESSVSFSKLESTDQDSHPELGESADEHYTRLFCHHVVEKNDVLELFGCDIPRELQRHQLSVAYVSLNLVQDDEDHLPLSQNTDMSPLDVPASESCDGHLEKTSMPSAAIGSILDKISLGTARLLINGPAGAGKSTLMRWCAINSAQQILTDLSSPKSEFGYDLGAKGREEPFDETGAWRRKIPLLIRLRDFPTGQLPSARELPNFLAKHLPQAPSNWMTDVLSSGQAIILLDGVDEVHRDQRPQLAEEISELICTYPDCFYVVTTRPGAVEPGWLNRLGFTEAHVEPMSRRDREEFIERWYRSASLELKQRPRPGENLIMTATRLKTELVDQPELGVLATNPLLCAMICALYRERQEKLPETPAELSEALCNMLLHRRERETLGLADKHFLSTWRALLYPQKKGLLAELAWYMIGKGDSSIDISVAKTIVAETLDSTPGRTKDEADDVVQALIERSGLLRPASDDSIDFLHNTLKEYLAAGRVVETANWQSLADHSDDPAWQPVILFALALAPEPFSSGLIAQLLKLVTPVVISTKRAGSLTKREREILVTKKAREFFLVRCQAVAKRLAPNLSNNIDEFLNNLLPPASMNEVEALVQLGPRVLLYGANTLENSNWWATQNCHMVARCLRLLRLIGGPRAKAALMSACRLPTYSSHVNNEWLLASSELFPDEHIPSPFEKITHFFLTSSAITDISRLGALKTLTHLDIDGTAVSSLAALAGMHQLQSLSLQRTPVNDLTPVNGLTSLRNINISNTMVTDLCPIANLNSLKSLYCRFTKIRDLSVLSRFEMLQVLDLQGIPIEDICPLSSLTSLEYLNCGFTDVVDLAPLSDLIALKHLDLRRTRVQDLSPLAALTHLQTLILWRTKVSDIGAISELPNLKQLNLLGVSVTDFTPLANFVRLQRLDLCATQITDLSPLTSLIHLRNLDLRGTEISDLTPLSELRNLRQLDLSSEGIVDLHPIANLPYLENLNLGGTTNADFSPLLELPQLKLLRIKYSNSDSQIYEKFKIKRPDVRVIVNKSLLQNTYYEFGHNTDNTLTH